MDPGGGALNELRGLFVSAACCLMFLLLEDDEGAGFGTKGTGMRTPGAVGGNAAPFVD
jgi:hypothetical protein